MAAARRHEWEHQQNQGLLFLVGAAVAIVGLAAAVPWVCAMLAGWVHSGRLPQLGLQEAVQTAFSREFWSGDPAAAYPRDVQRLLPGGWGFWSTAVLLVVLIAAVVVAVARAIEARMGHAIADRRWYHVFLGRRPQAFGRYRSVKPLLVDGRTPERVIVGRIGKPPALIAVQNEVQICAIAAPRSGKTSGLVTPALLEHDGPAVTTSTKTDVVLATRARRERMGETFVWDPVRRAQPLLGPAAGLRVLGARAAGRALARPRRAARPDRQRRVLRRGGAGARRAAAARRRDHRRPDDRRRLPLGARPRRQDPDPGPDRGGRRGRAGAPGVGVRAQRPPARRRAGHRAGAAEGLRAPGGRAHRGPRTRASAPSGCSTAPPTRSTWSPGASISGCSPRWW